MARRTAARPPKPWGLAKRHPPDGGAVAQTPAWPTGGPRRMAATPPWSRSCVTTCARAPPAGMGRIPRASRGRKRSSCRKVRCHTLLFCASLPECYVPPQLAEVLHVAGQLEAAPSTASARRRRWCFRSCSRAAPPIRPVAASPGVLKVRLIHATIRHLDPARQSGAGRRRHCRPAAARHRAGPR